jgi:hypothetical protein
MNFKKALRSIPFDCPFVFSAFFDRELSCLGLLIIYRYMSFLTLRQQVDNWTLQEDDQVSDSPLSSLKLCNLYRKLFSSQKDKSIKKYQILNIL